MNFRISPSTSECTGDALPWSGHRRRTALGGTARDIGVQSFDDGGIARRGDVTGQHVLPYAARALGRRFGAVVGPTAGIAPIGHQGGIERAAISLHRMGTAEE